MEQALIDFFNLINNGIYIPLRNAISNTGIFNQFFNFLGSIINSIFFLNENPISIGSGLVATGISIYVIVISFRFIIWLFKSSFSVLKNATYSMFNTNNNKEWRSTWKRRHK